VRVRALLRGKHSHDALQAHTRKSKAKVAERTAGLEQAMERLQGLGLMQAKAAMLASVSDELLRTSQESGGPGKGARSLPRVQRAGTDQVEPRLEKLPALSRTPQRVAELRERFTELCYAASSINFNVAEHNQLFEEMLDGLRHLKGGNTMSAEIRVFIVDDDYYMRQALLALLWKESGVKVVGMASCPEELIYLASNGDIQEADVVLLDMKYIGNEMTGINAIEEIRGEVPEAKIVILSMLRQADLVLEAVRAGADGYLWKMEIADKVADAIRKVYCGHFVATQSLGNIPFDKPVALII
jgi:ActR/RegA family two-component response regulator